MRQYQGNRLAGDYPRQTAYSVYDPETRTWAAWRTVKMPDDARFYSSGAGCTQRVDLPNGDILLPERGARLGNFGVTNVSDRETWVTVTEWMQTWGPNYVLPVNNEYGADNSVFVARIKWRRPNRLVGH